MPSPTQTPSPLPTPAPGPTASSTNAPTATATHTATATPTPVPTATPHPGAAATTSAATYIHPNPRATHRDSNTHAAAAYADPNSGAAPATVQSNIIDFVLQDLAIKAGDTVLWTNQGAATHTTTSGSDGGFDGQGWNSPFLSTDESFSHTFTSAGSFPYTCTIHPFMNATVTVTD